MIGLLEKIRKPVINRPFGNKVFHTYLVFMIGVILGLISRILDFVDLKYINEIFVYFDLGAFFSRMSIWLLCALTVSVFSKTPLRAIINVFVFFIGMLLSYYSATYFIEGFVFKKVIMYWLLLTIFSPLPALLCWYAKGKGKFATFISSVILAVFFVMAFSFGFDYFNFRYNGMEAVNWLLAILILWNNPKQSFKVLIYSLLFATVARVIYVYFFRDFLMWGFMKL